MLQTLGMKSYMSVALEVAGEADGGIVFAASESGRQVHGDRPGCGRGPRPPRRRRHREPRLYAEVSENARRKDEFLAMLAHEFGIRWRRSAAAWT